MSTSTTMIWFLSTTIGVMLLLALGMLVAVHTYDKHK